MTKAFWRGALAAGNILLWAALLGLFVWKNEAVGIVISFTLLVCQVATNSIWLRDNKAEEARIARKPNVFGLEPGRIIFTKAAVVGSLNGDDAAIWLGNPSLEQVELGLFEDDWVHTSKGWTKG